MREHAAAARRMVVGGAVLLAVALAGIAAAAGVLVARIREGDVADAETRLRAKVDGWFRSVGDEDSDWFVVDVGPDGRLSGRLGESFAPLPPASGSELRFVLDQMVQAPDERTRRAACETALASDEAPARLAAAAWGAAQSQEPGARPAREWLDRAQIPDELEDTAEAVLLGLLAGDPRAQERACAAIGSADDVRAASMLVACSRPGAPTGDADADARAVAAHVQRLRRWAEDRRIVAADAPSLAIREISPSGWAPWPRARAALLADGTCIVGQEREGGGAWRYVRHTRASVAAATRKSLEPVGIRLVPRGSAHRGVAIPVESGWTAVWDRPPVGDPARERVLLASFAAAAVAAVAAFAFFVRAVRREAAAAEARADFVATVSHELRTPVAVVRTAAETLLADRAPRAEDRRQLVEAIVRESERLSGLVGNVLDFARMDAGTRRYAFRETAVEDLIEETVRRTDAVLRPAGFHVEVSVPEPLPRVECDPDALGAALANLLDNAAKFRGVSDRATVRATSDGRLVTVEVEDHGVGIPDDEKPRVLQRFFRGADPRVRETRGSGIGLSLVQHAVEAHGGRVEVSDTPGGGTTVRLILPVRRS